MRERLDSLQVLEPSSSRLRLHQQAVKKVHHAPVLDIRSLSWLFQVENWHSLCIQMLGFLTLRSVTLLGPVLPLLHFVASSTELQLRISET